MWVKGEEKEEVMEKGIGILVPVLDPAEVTPNKHGAYFMRAGDQWTRYFATYFSNLVDWQTIVDFCKLGYIWKRK